MEIGKRVKALRKDKNLTLKELSDKIGISVSFLSDIENNRSKPSLERLIEIAEALSTTVSFLLGEENYVVNDKIYHNINTEGLSEEDIAKVEEYIEFLKQRYNPDGSLKKK